MTQTQELALVTLKTDNLEAAQDYVFVDFAKIYNTGAVSASTDPFSGKTNKYAESAALLITSTLGFYYLMSAAGTAVTAANGMFNPPNTPLKLVVDPSTPYLRVIPTASAVVTVAELPGHVSAS